ncbi:MAG: HNH endonuclease [Acidobacteriaceae bacterium]|nr:HNH endonuclease [Acidobacteriaceae bacterium]
MKSRSAPGYFPPKVKTQALVAVGRHCCLCHKYCGTKIECHHIVPVEEGGPNTRANCIPLCFNCHAEVQSYNEKHPKGNRFRPEELKAHRDNWYKQVRSGFQEDVRPIYEADRKLFADFLRILPSNGMAVYQLRHEPFGSTFRWEAGDALREFLNEREGPEYEFLDTELEQLRVDLRKCILELIDAIATNTFIARHSTAGDPILQFDRELGYKDPREYERRRSEVIDAADRAYQAYVTFIRQCRKQLES